MSGKRIALQKTTGHCLAWATEMGIKHLRALILAATVIPTVGMAHHSHASLNRDDVRTYKGVVTKYGWTMPHVYLKVKAPGENGEVVEYTIEMEHPPAMVAKGWSKTTWKPGDRIVWQGPHDKDLNRHYSGLSWAETADGTRVGNSEEMVAEAVPSTDFTGLWKRSDPGGFEPHYKPPVDWPLTKIGQALVDGFDENENPMVTCGNPGPPKSMLIPYPISFTRPDANTLIMERELMDELRVVHFDRDHEVGPPSKMGHSIGWFEGDTLIVETSNFVADKWGIHTGISSSEQKHLVEKFTMSNGGLNLDVEITVTDPVYLAEPVSFSHHWRKLADREVVQAPCTMEAAQLYLEAGYQ
jgi:hypothetical protein